VPLARNDKL